MFQVENFKINTFCKLIASKKKFNLLCYKNDFDRSIKES